MKKTNKFREEIARDDFSITERHIHFLSIHAFVSEGVDFTEEENAHFDACRHCRLKVIDAIRSLPPLVVPTITTKAA